MRIVFAGSGEFGIPSLEAMTQSEHRVCGIVTQPARSAGRGRKSRPTPVAAWAQQRDLPYWETANINDVPTLDVLTKHRPDVMVVIAFGQKIGQQVVTLPKKGSINVHASLLPRWRGAAPINWAIIEGDTVTGISIITLAERMDAGEILAAAQTPIQEQETAGDLHDRLAHLAAPVLIETLTNIANGTAVYEPQDESQVTLAPKLKKSDGYLDFDQPAEVLAQRIRGLWPWPGATADYVSQRSHKTCRVTIARAEVVETASTPILVPGTLNDDMHIVCARGTLRILEIKPAGSDLMCCRDFVNGRHCCPGDRLVPIDPQAAP
jgi:methionyl-tRNA formyltransferase